MARHDRANASSNCGSKRYELVILEFLTVIRNNRQRKMRVGGYIAMAGEMFGGCKRAIFFDATNELSGEISHLSRILSKRADVDNRIPGIVINIGVGSEYPVNSDGAGLKRGVLTSCISELWVVCRTDCHSRGEVRSLIEPHASAALKIGPDQERCLGMSLESIRNHGCGIHLAALNSQRPPNSTEDKSSNVIVLHLMKQILVCRAFSGLKNAEIVKHQHLAEFFADGHFP